MSEAGIVGIVAGAAAKSAIILALALMVTISWRSASAAAKHMVLTIAVTASLAVPLIAVAIARLNAPRIEIAAWSSSPFVAPVATSVTEDVPAAAPNDVSVATAADTHTETVADVPTQVETRAAEPIVVETSAEPEAPVDWKARLIEIWLAGIAIALIPLVTALLKVRSIRRGARVVRESNWHSLIRATPAIAHLADRVTVLESSDTAMPMTWGIIRPTLLVPSNADRWPEWQRRDIVLHELAHVERRDCLTQLVAQIACAVYWFNPLAWVAAARMKVERELACDDRVISAGSRASDYASNLLDVARSLRAPSLTSNTAIAMARPSQLSGRLLAVLDSRRNRRRVTRRIAASASFAASAVVLIVASLTPAAAATLREEPALMSQPEVGASNIHISSGSTFTPLTQLPTAIVRAAQLPNIGPIAIAMPGSTPLKAELSSPALPVLGMQGASCWDGSDGSSSVTVNSDDKRKSYTVRYSRSDCSLELRAEGEFTLRPDLS
ncbi:MAG TPA: M56 family metallopeptidase, partial [Gemmatimonadaceae bacterium]